MVTLDCCPALHGLQPHASLETPHPSKQSLPSAAYSILHAYRKTCYQSKSAINARLFTPKEKRIPVFGGMEIRMVLYSPNTCQMPHRRYMRGGTMGGFTTDAARSHESCVLLRGILSEGSLGILIFSHDCLQVDEQEPGLAFTC